MSLWRPEYVSNISFFFDLSLAGSLAFPAQLRNVRMRFILSQFSNVSHWNAASCSALKMLPHREIKKTLCLMCAVNLIVFYIQADAASAAAFISFW